MTPNHTTKASDWHAARTAGQRLAEHVLPEDAVTCPICGEVMTLTADQGRCEPCRVTLDLM